MFGGDGDKTIKVSIESMERQAATALNSIEQRHQIVLQQMLDLDLE